MNIFRISNKNLKMALWNVLINVWIGDNFLHNKNKTVKYIRPCAFPKELTFEKDYRHFPRCFLEERENYFDSDCILWCPKTCRVSLDKINSKTKFHVHLEFLKNFFPKKFCFKEKKNYTVIKNQSFLSGTSLDQKLILFVSLFRKA